MEELAAVEAEAFLPAVMTAFAGEALLVRTRPFERSVGPCLARSLPFGAFGTEVTLRALAVERRGLHRTAGAVEARGALNGRDGSQRRTIPAVQAGQAVLKVAAALVLLVRARGTGDPRPVLAIEATTAQLLILHALVRALVAVHAHLAGAGARVRVVRPVHAWHGFKRARSAVRARLTTEPGGPVSRVGHCRTAEANVARLAWPHILLIADTLRGAVESGRTPPTRGTVRQSLLRAHTACGTLLWLGLASGAEVARWTAVVARELVLAEVGVPAVAAVFDGEGGGGSAGAEMPLCAPPGRFFEAARCAEVTRRAQEAVLRGHSETARLGGAVGAYGAGVRCEESSAGWTEVTCFADLG